MTEYNMQRYQAAAHAVQSGVQAMLSIGHDQQASPKMLRTGVNMAMVDHGALVALLIEKGLFTLNEYEAKLAEYAEREQATYEKELTEFYGKPIRLM